ncbi:putative F-box domain-containing protein [Rosa chinensis]|uniref:Putative F-box domain-containing protein n=1 Tax=Rosa chinensis TaxID=74649 RepID=A0A2P6QLQ0_ROSCH|nr:F-box/kelch-repeat protein At3g06240 [Rosa chinensis]PRQ35079.1 putative F-box domain-containing protein [Rosa chinensis]
MSMSKTQEESFDLHEDVIVKILCRLPVKSLIRFTCVSKRWRSIIISDPQFGKSHLQLASQQGSLCQKVLICIYPTDKTVEGRIPNRFEDNMPWFPSRFQSLEGYSSVNNLTFPSEEKSQRVMASCNGLVLLGESYKSYFKNLSIWNPSTGFFRKIPAPSFGVEMTKSTEEKKNCSFLYHGFGQVSSTDDYKLVFTKPALGDFVEVHVFSLRANVWKVIKSPSSLTGWIDGQGAVSNGAIHWVNYPTGGKIEPTMVAFDLAEEEFRQVPLPVFNQNEDDTHVTCVRTHVLLGGCLGVWSADPYGYRTFWVMREYDVPESWVKLIQLGRDDLPDEFTSCPSWEPSFVTEGGTVMIKLLGKERRFITEDGTVYMIKLPGKNELVWIDCHQEENTVCRAHYRLEEVPECTIFDITVYDETLVSVPE